VSDLLFGQLFGHMESIRDRVKAWLFRDNREGWIPLDETDIGWLSEYRTAIQQKHGHRTTQITIEWEIEDLKTGEKKLEVIKVENPIMLDLAQALNWPTAGAPSNCYLVQLMALAKRE
jgi:hypothetical protein